MVLKILGSLLIGAMLTGSTGTDTNPDSVSITDHSKPTVVLQMEEDENEEIAFLPLGIYLKPVSYEEGQLTITIDNQSGYAYYYGKEYYLQKKDGEEWVDVEAVTEYGWPKISLMINDLETAEEVYDLTVFGELEAGNYKLLKNDQEMEFTLMEAGPEESTTTAADSTFPEAYQKIVDHIAELLASGEDLEMIPAEEEDDYVGVIAEIIALGKEKASESLCYSLYDLNQDGVNELIISSRCQVDPRFEYTDPAFKAGYSVLNIYTTNGEDAVLLAQSWLRNSWFVNADGLLLCEGSGGAIYHDLFIYELGDRASELTEKYHLYTAQIEETGEIVLMESFDAEDASTILQSKNPADSKIWDSFDVTKESYTEQMLILDLIPVYAEESSEIQ